LLPFVNGLMLGFGELVANEAAFRLGWSGTKVRYTSIWEERGRERGGGDNLNEKWRRWMNKRLIFVMGKSADRFHRSSLLDEVRDALARVSRCVRILWRGGGGMVRSWICTLLWSRYRTYDVIRGYERAVGDTLQGPKRTHRRIGQMRWLAWITASEGECYQNANLDKTWKCIMEQMRRRLRPSICTGIYKYNVRRPCAFAHDITPKMQ
jgi:hypothetical protein